MKTTKATTEPAPPVVKYVANTWHQAHRDNVKEITLRLAADKVTLSFDSQEHHGPTANLFDPMTREFLSYSGTRIWPWTKSIRGKTCRVEAGDSTAVWTMNSANLKQELIINRD
jgi:hypothetical protein